MTSNICLKDMCRDMKITDPKNDAEMDALHERIVKGAEYLEHPFIAEEDKRKGMQLYDELVRVYRKSLEALG